MGGPGAVELSLRPTPVGPEEAGSNSDSHLVISRHTPHKYIPRSEAGHENVRVLTGSESTCQQSMGKAEVRCEEQSLTAQSFPWWRLLSKAHPHPGRSPGRPASVSLGTNIQSPPSPLPLLTWPLAVRASAGFACKTSASACLFQTCPFVWGGVGCLRMQASA